jgi:hypothetical protein
MPDEQLLSRLHYHLIRGLVEECACPTNPELAHQLGVPTNQVEELLRGLSAIHGVVLHPHVCEPWVIHPFSITPTANWIEGPRGGWWAPCVWCALGVAVLGGVRLGSILGWPGNPSRSPSRSRMESQRHSTTFGYTLRFPRPKPGGTFTNTARWSFRSAPRKRLALGAQGTGSRTEKQCLFRKSPFWLGSGTALTPNVIGTSGR